MIERRRHNRNPVAKAVRTPQFRLRIVQSSKVQDDEFFSIETVASLLKYHRARAIKLDGNGGNEQNWPKEKDRDEGNTEVESPLGRKFGFAEPCPFDCKIGSKIEYPGRCGFVRLRLGADPSFHNVIKFAEKHPDIPPVVRNNA